MLAAFRRGLGSTGDVSAADRPRATSGPVRRRDPGAPAAARQAQSGPAEVTESSRRRTWVSRAVLVRDPVRAGGADAADAQHGVRGRGAVPVLGPPGDRALAARRGAAGQLRHLLLRRARCSTRCSAPLADSIGGLAAARAVSLLAMLTTTGLLYSLTRRLFNERVGLCATVIFSVTESALFLGNLATYDAPALCLLASRPGSWCAPPRSAGRCTCWPRCRSRSRWPPSTPRCCSCRPSCCSARWRRGRTAGARR